MNTELLDELMMLTKCGKKGPQQYPPVWRAFMEFYGAHQGKYNIEAPIVVELGIYKNNQKQFWEQLFGAEHIGIDISDKYSIPDILGDTHKPKTFIKLKRKLKKRPIDVLFIDAWHSYESVKKDFEMYSLLCNDVVAFHDIDLCRHQERKNCQVWKFWDELKRMHEYSEFLFIGIHKKKAAGIGIMIKR